MEQLNIKELDITISDLWKNSILCSLSHAIKVWDYPDISYEQSWDGFNYCINDSMGTRGTITFYNDEICIGAFRNNDNVNSKNTDLYKSFLQEMPDNIKNIANKEAYQYLLDDVGGKTQPLVTLVIWSDNNKLFCIDPNNDINECEFINRLLLPYEELIENLVEYNDLSSANLVLLKELYTEIINKNKVVLTKEQIKLTDCTDDNLEVSIESFKELGILIED